MPATNAKTESGSFSAEERAAMKKRAAELRAEGKKGAKKADGLQAVLDSIAEMAPQDRALAERVHVTVSATAPELAPKTWYGMPAYANADGKVVVFFQNAGKFSYRYSTLGFQDAANLDDGDVWPVSYALKNLMALRAAPGSMRMAVRMWPADVGTAWLCEIVLKNDAGALTFGCPPVASRTRVSVSLFTSGAPRAACARPVPDLTWEAGRHASAVRAVCGD
jgi:uncharacterized protein YdhG (YjbR/CyaY superfamily)